MDDQVRTHRTDASGTCPEPPSDAVKRLLPWLVAVAYFMESLDTTILNTAVPVIAKAMDVPPLSMKAVLASYTLSLAIFIPISGWMADRFGTRRVFAGAIGLFTLASLLAGLSQNMYMLIACRILQGCGGAMMVPVGRLTLVRTFDRTEFIRILSLVTIPGWIGPVIGPTVGGFMVAHLHWSFIFFVNVPIGIIGLILVARYLPDYREEKRPPDILGFVLFGAGVALMSYVLEIFGEHILTPSQSIALLVISIALILAYGYHSLRTRWPLLELGLFRIRTFRISVSGSFFTRLGVGGVPFLLPLLYQIPLGFTPMQSGLLIMPQAIGGILAKLALSRILDRLGYRNMLTSNTIILGALLMLFATVGPYTPVWLIVLQASLYGAFSSLQYTAMNSMAYADMDPHKTSSAGSIASTAQELSISFGIAAAGLITAFFIPEHAPSHAKAMMGFGLHEAFIVLGIMTMLSTFIFGGLKREDGEGVVHRSQVRMNRGYR
ncbi:DHA2 family efflux MFS transporter permease subunit [Rhodomicrobium vannielii ATCC 17100]|uniref:DHA2 family efflux MFS transporter permease subunit n=1 Tax=Rhodomicrobium vannielii TaxID=1069 RepID=UPI00191A6415|nr:DHA2 family efflux MFS transporter permease subunit [Rhodomicrobium vannielii]MBJ7534637.1 DHA2 family efflux MFS transporter permease subunit [Rhodomicrobium vannielii ATCC 17100]